jgi:hypothetical protein
MPRILQPYPDVAKAVMLLVESWFPEDFAPIGEDYRTGRVFPPNLQDTIAAGGAFCRVTDIGGNDDGLTDHPLIDVDVLAPSFKRARDLSLGIQARLLGYPWRAGSTVIDKVRTAMRPHDVPWDDDNTFRFYSSYTISARR